MLLMPDILPMTPPFSDARYSSRVSSSYKSEGFPEHYLWIHLEGMAQDSASETCATFALTSGFAARPG